MLAIVQAWCFSLFGHVAYETDANEELNSFPLGELEETTGTPHTTWMKTIQQDLKSSNLSLRMKQLMWLRIVHSGD